MTDLSQKFTTFEQQSATQHNELMAALTATNNKLDTLISLQGGAPPTASVTLADVLAAIQGTNVYLGNVLGVLGTPEGVRGTLAQLGYDIHLDTQSMDLKLLAMRDTLLNTYEFLTVPNPYTAQILGAIGNPLAPAGATVIGLLNRIMTADEALEVVVGTPGSSNQTVLGWLREIADCSCSDGAEPPPLTGCTSPFVSSGMGLVPFSVAGYGDLTVATWPDSLPAGLSFGSNFGITVDKGQLHNDDWSGWRVFVQSSAANYARQPTDLGRYATGVWLTLPSGPADYSFAVPGKESITVTLCPTSEASQVCQTFQLAGLEVARLGWHLSPTTIEIVSPSNGKASLYFYKWDDGDVYANRVLEGQGQKAEYLDLGHIAIQNASPSDMLTIKVCSPTPGAEPYTG